MPLYPFETQLAIDSDHPDVVIRNGTVTYYDPEDAAMLSPLALVDTSGLPVSNPVGTNSVGMVRAFQAEIPQVRWTDGTYSGYLNSFKGLLAEMVAARDLMADMALAGIPVGGTTGQVLVKKSAADRDVEWRTLVVSIGPTDPWPTGLPDGTIVVRREV